MNFIVWISIVSGIISILSFSFAIWVWVRSDMHVRELTKTLKSIYIISGDILWEDTKLPGEDMNARQLQAARMHGLASSIHTLSSEYIQELSKQRWSGTELSALIERGIVWTTPMLWNIEEAPETKEVWLATPDLKPDLSDRIMGEIVGSNIKKGKRYIYFVPTSLTNLPDLTVRLKVNLGVGTSRSRLADRVVVTQIETQEYIRTLGTGNVILFFSGDSSKSRGSVFREIVFSKVSERGIFWQECPEVEADSLYSFLRDKIIGTH